MRLRPFIADDLERFCEINTSEEVCKYLSWGPNTKEQAEAYFNHILTYPSRHLVLDYESRLRAMVELKPMTKDQVALTYIVHPDSWGDGFGSTAVSIALEVARMQGFSFVYASVDPDNIASEKILTKYLKPAYNELQVEGTNIIRKVFTKTL